MDNSKFLSDEIIELENCVHDALKNISICEKEKDKIFFFNEYKRLKSMLDEKLNEWAKFLTYEAI